MQCIHFPALRCAAQIPVQRVRREDSPLARTYGHFIRVLVRSISAVSVHIRTTHSPGNLTLWTRYERHTYAFIWNPYSWIAILYSARTHAHISCAPHLECNDNECLWSPDCPPGIKSYTPASSWWSICFPRHVSFSLRFCFPAKLIFLWSACAKKAWGKSTKIL